jgi:hypothetical protein
MTHKPFIGMTTKPSVLILNETGRFSLPDFEQMLNLMSLMSRELFIASRRQIAFLTLMLV